MVASFSLSTDQLAADVCSDAVVHLCVVHTCFRVCLCCSAEEACVTDFNSRDCPGGTTYDNTVVCDGACDEAECCT